MKTLLSLLVAAGLVVAAFPEQTPELATRPAPQSLTSDQQTCLERAYHHERAGWIFLHIEGPPRERGFQHGYLMAAEIAEGLRVRRAVWWHNTAMVVDTAMAKRMSFAARWGSACGRALDAKEHLRAHPQFYWLEGLLKDLPAQPWVEFTSGEKP